MCGIVGAVDILVDAQSRQRALDAMVRRGPDSAGEWSIATPHPVWLGHRRLSIVDLSELGSQPMSNEDGTVWLVCNGEIYNAPRLRSDLEGRGHSFSSRSDSEVILHAYETWGEACIEKLDGMFAFCIWDTHRQRLLLARDRVGIKPLAYATEGRGLVFASDLNAILPLLAEQPRLDHTSLAYVLSLGYIPSPRSIWKGIQKLDPGHFLSWDAVSGKIEISCYWEPPRALRSGADDEDEWRALFKETVRAHLLSDVPIGLFLSGGIDSTSLAVQVAELGEPVDALTIAFPDHPQDESQVAAATARHLQIRHNCERLAPTTIDDLLTETLAAYDEPQGYSALLTMFAVTRKAAGRYKVILGGDGGDELLGGYSWYHSLSPTAGSSAGVLRALARRMPGLSGSSIASRLDLRAFETASPLHRHAMRLFPRFLPEEVQALMSPCGIEFDDERMLAPLRRYLVPELPLKRALQRVDLMTFCTDSILAKVDKASMYHSIEVRVPYLDHRLLEWGLSRPLAPDEDEVSKACLRRYLTGRVPEMVLQHPKQGFSIRGMESMDWDAAIDRIAQGPLVKDGLFAPAWRDLCRLRRPYREARIWCLLMLSRWAEQNLQAGRAIAC